MLGVRALSATAATLMGLLIAPDPASACRFLTQRPPIAGEFQTIVIADVDVARDTGVNNAWVWEIESRLTEVVTGQPAAETYGFRYTTGTNGCSSAPPTGRFVLYIAKTVAGERVVQSLPLEEALTVDPRVNAARQGH